MTQCQHMLALLCGWLLASSEALLLDMYLIGGEKTACPRDYQKVRTSGGLNGDLNQGAGGKYLYLCVLYGVASDFNKAPIETLAVVGGGSGVHCGNWNYLSHDGNSNGDLNQGAGGDYILLCYKRGNSHPIEDIYLSRSSDCDSSYNRIRNFGADGGDFNNDAGGKDIYMCEREACLARKVTGEWKPMFTIAAPTTEKWQHGTSKTHAMSKTEDWSWSVTATVSAGFELKGLSGSTEISSTWAHSTSQTYSSEWTTNEERSFSISWGAEDVGNISWQFNFSPYDSCGHTEVSLTKEKALTEGRWRPPCCLPGFSTDAPFYTKCHSREVMIADGARYGCSVASTVELSEYFQSRNRSMPMHGGSGTTNAAGAAELSEPQLV